MRIGAVAEALGISSSAIRYYERQGLIQPIGRVSGRRELDKKTIVSLRFLKLAQAAGFSLNETRKLLEFGFGDRRPQDDWQSFIHQKQSDLRSQIDTLRGMVALLDKLESCRCSSIEDCMSEDAELQRRGA
jgi:MerR family redox-sensitive transcriptional activator SoxR